MGFSAGKSIYPSWPALYLDQYGPKVFQDTSILMVQSWCFE